MLTVLVIFSFIVFLISVGVLVRSFCRYKKNRTFNRWSTEVLLPFVLAILSITVELIIAFLSAEGTGTQSNSGNVYTADNMTKNEVMGNQYNQYNVYTQPSSDRSESDKITHAQGTEKNLQFGQEKLRVEAAPVQSGLREQLRGTHGIDYTQLTDQQVLVLEDLTADELPTEAADFSSFTRDQVWQDVLLPLVSDPYEDITIYGVINDDWLRTAKEDRNGKLSLCCIENSVDDGIVLRHKDRIATYSINWEGNAWYGMTPSLFIGDFNNDETRDLAVCFHEGVGSTTIPELYIFDLNSLQFKTPDLSTLELEAKWNSHTHDITIDSGNYTTKITLPEEIARLIDSVINNGEFRNTVYCAGKTLRFDLNYEITCSFNLGFEEQGLYFTRINVPIIWNDEYKQYCLGEITGIGNL